MFHQIAPQETPQQRADRMLTADRILRQRARDPRDTVYACSGCDVLRETASEFCPHCEEDTQGYVAGGEA